MTDDGRRRGWFKLWRAFFDGAVWNHRNRAVPLVALRLLAEANWKASKLDDGRRILPGEVVLDRRGFARRCNVSEQSFRTALSHLEKLEFLTHESTRRYTLVTIRNWETYQSEELADQPNNQPTANPQLTHDQPTTNPIIERNKTRSKELACTPSLPELQSRSPVNGTGSDALIDHAGLIAWFSQQFPANVFESDVRLLLSIIEAPEDEALLRANLPLWKATRRWREGYAPTAENFLSKRMWTQPPKAETQAEGRPDDVWERVH